VNELNVANFTKGENFKEIYQILIRANEQKLETDVIDHGEEECRVASSEEEKLESVPDIKKNSSSFGDLNKSSESSVSLSCSVPSSENYFSSRKQSVDIDDDNRTFLSTKKKISNILKSSIRNKGCAKLRNENKTEYTPESGSTFYCQAQERLPRSVRRSREQANRRSSSLNLLLSRKAGGGDGPGEGEKEEAIQGEKGSAVEAVSKSQDTCVNKMSMLQRLAMSALHLSAPASPLLLRQRRQSWVQLSGHPGSLAPAGPGTIWKKRGAEPHETEVYSRLMKDSARVIVPTFFREVAYADDHFIEMQDLLFPFKKPSLMDIKMGSRTFLEDEVANAKPREDLYKKMVAVAPLEPTAAERQAKAVTKRRYMQFREDLSSSRELGFRVEAMRVHGSPAETDMKTVRSRADVVAALSSFARRDGVRRALIRQLRRLRDVFERSDFFRVHEVIGSSLLLVYDEDQAGVWIIDFAKTRRLPEGVRVTHRKPWSPGNHEEGFLTGLDNLIEMMEQLKTSKPKKRSLFKKSKHAGSTDSDRN